MDRRRFLRQTALAGCGAMLAAAGPSARAETAQPKLHLACNQYPWLMFYRREGRDFSASLDAGLAEVARSGLDGFEPMFTAPEQVDPLAALLKKHGLEMRSLYVNSTLHKPEEVDKSIATVLAIAQRAKQAGTQIIVTNPSPIRWGGPENKDDQQLALQASALDNLGRELRSLGLTLAYHNHDIELRNAAREFHHMMVGTDPRHVSLCLDAHWIYRGAGNSSLALFDVLKLYGSRISELHLRQSAHNIWTEAFGEGDIDYRALARRLREIGVKPLLVLEQAPEKETPKTADAVESHRRGGKFARDLFAELASPEHS